MRYDVSLLFRECTLGRLRQKWPGSEAWPSSLLLLMQCTCPNGSKRDKNGDHGSLPCDQGKRSEAGGQPCLWSVRAGHQLPFQETPWLAISAEVFLPAGGRRGAPSAAARVCRAEIIGASNVNVESSVPPCDNTFTVVLCAGPLPERNRHNICDVDVQDTLAQRLPPLFAV
jgi:hypothetical protein